MAETTAIDQQTLPAPTAVARLTTDLAARRRGSLSALQVRQTPEGQHGTH